MKLGTCIAGYQLITEHKSSNVLMWDGELSTEGEYLFEVPEACIISREEVEDGYVEYEVDASHGDITYIGREQ